MNGGEGLAEVGVGGGATIEMGEPLTRGRLFADCLTIPLQLLDLLIFFSLVTIGLISFLFCTSGNLTAKLAQSVVMLIG